MVTMFRTTLTRSLNAACKMNAARSMRLAPINLQRVSFYSSLPEAEVSKRVFDVIKGFDKTSQAVGISEASNFSADLGLDSLDTVEVLVAIEEEFDIEIPDKEADEIKTVGQAINYIVSNPDAN